MTSGANAANSLTPLRMLSALPAPQADIDLQVASLGPTQLPQPLQERCEVSLCARTLRGQCHEHADAPHPLLRAHGERPRNGRRRRTAESRNELAADHSITSSARASNVGGISRPSDFAVLRLMTSSNVVGS